jgi:hypothetical protein
MILGVDGSATIVEVAGRPFCGAVRSRLAGGLLTTCAKLETRDYFGTFMRRAYVDE